MTVGEVTGELTRKNILGVCVFLESFCNIPFLRNLCEIKKKQSVNSK